MQKIDTDKLATKIRVDRGFRGALIENIDKLGEEDRSAVIAGVVKSGICDDPLVRAIRNDAGTGTAPNNKSGSLMLEDLIREYDEKNNK